MKGPVSHLDLPAPHAYLHASALTVVHACGHVVRYDVRDSHVHTVNRLANLYVEPCIECAAQELEAVRPAITCDPPIIDRDTVADIAATSASRLDTIATITRFLNDDPHHMLQPSYFRHHHATAAWYAGLGTLLESSSGQFWTWVNTYGVAELIHHYNLYYEMRGTLARGEKQRLELGHPLQLLIHRQLHHWNDMELAEGGSREA